MAQVRGRSNFGMGYRDVMALPIEMRDYLIEQLQIWRRDENTKKD